MVKLSSSLWDTIIKKRKRGFLDSIRVYVRGGPGGSGFPKFGGVGGKGGDIYIVGKEEILLNSVVSKYPNKRIVGSAGEPSRNYSILGKPGGDTEVAVPLGVTVSTDEGIVLGEINSQKDKVLVAYGGVGGNSLNQYNGAKGISRSVTLDLKIIADVGFVGFPNAGKSTLLKALSRATPQIANYPFTTIKPNLGILEFDDFRQITLADLPGLIEGAHVNYGLGHSFLKHVVRTKLLLFVIDVHGFRLSLKTKFRTAFETILLLNKELELYKENVIDKPAMLVFTKMDLEGAETKLEECLDQVKNVDQLLDTLPPELRPNRVIQFDKILPICAQKKNGLNLEKLKVNLRETIDLNFETSNTNSSRTFMSTKNDNKEVSDLIIR